MRQQVNQERLLSFFHSLAARTHEKLDVYVTGGATALLHGWRQSTIDVDLIMIPEIDQVFQSFPELKNSLNINIEIASPAHFIPELPDWKSRSIFIQQIGSVSFHHYDLYSQAISKIERGHVQDLKDVQNMMNNKLVDLKILQGLFQQILTKLYKYPAIDEKYFVSTFETFIRNYKEKS